MSLYSASKWEAPDRNFVGHRDTLVRNMSRYHFAAAPARGRCLDIGCGRGYGFEYLVSKCSSCVGLDVSASFLAEARAHFPDVSFVQHTAEELPFEDASFDTITSFEVIEHVQDDGAFLREIRRVAGPHATVAISTPNRAVASGDRERPLNKFHVREYSPPEFQGLLESVFARVELFGQFDGPAGPTVRKALVDRIPVRLKYLIPAYVQDVISVTIRPPLKIEDCRFEPASFEGAHTLYATCHT